ALSGKNRTVRKPNRGFLDAGSAQELSNEARDDFAISRRRQPVARCARFALWLHPANSSEEHIALSVRPRERGGPEHCDFREPKGVVERPADPGRAWPKRFRAPGRDHAKDANALWAFRYQRLSDSGRLNQRPVGHVRQLERERIRLLLRRKGQH